MNNINHRALAEDWIRYINLPKKKQNEHKLLFSAYCDLDLLVHDQPEEAWKVIEIMWQLDSSDMILANIAAGPVEDLLCLHGEQFIDRVENLARQEKVFKKLLGAVWGESGMPKEIYSRLKAVAGPSF